MSHVWEVLTNNGIELMEAKIVPEIPLHPTKFRYYFLLAFVGIPSIELTSKATVIVSRSTRFPIGITRRRRRGGELRW